MSSLSLVCHVQKKPFLSFSFLFFFFPSYSLHNNSHCVRDDCDHCQRGYCATTPLYKVNRIRYDHRVGAPKHSTDDHWSVTGAFYSELHIILTAER